jgi:hypothetical protein
MCSTAYDAVAKDLWKTIHVKTCCLSKTFSTILTLLSSRRDIRKHAVRLVLEGSSEVELPFRVNLLTLLNDTERSQLIPLLAAVLPTIREVELVDYVLPLETFETLIRSCGSLESLRFSGYDVYRNNSAIEMPSYVYETETIFAGVGLSNLRKLDMSGCRFDSGAWLHLVDCLPGLPNLESLDLTFTGAHYITVLQLLDRAPKLREFGWSPDNHLGYGSSRTSRDDINAAHLLQRCPKLERLVINTAEHFFPDPDMYLHVGRS